MSEQAVKSYPYYEYLDLLACLAVYNGTAKQKKKKKKMNILDALKLQ